MAKDWTEIQKKYKGLWVALADDEETVIASGKSLRDTLDGAKKKGHKDPIVIRMPEKLAAYAGVL